MKYLIFLSIIIASLASCKKKKYNCHCTTTVNYTYSGRLGSYSSSTIAMDKKMTEKQAKSVCADEAKNIDATTTNFLTNNGTSSSNGTTARTICTIQ